MSPEPHRIIWAGLGDHHSILYWIPSSMPVEPREKRRKIEILIRPQIEGGLVTHVEPGPDRDACYAHVVYRATCCSPLRSR